MPLKLSLRPGEKFVLNGAVVQNGDRRGVLVLQNKASVLREKDIMQQEQANTPARRIYFPVMMMYLDEAGAERYYDEFVRRMSEFMGVQIFAIALLLAFPAIATWLPEHLHRPEPALDLFDSEPYPDEGGYYQAMPGPVVPTPDLQRS